MKALGSIFFAVGYVAGCLAPFVFIGMCVGALAGGAWLGFEWVVR